MKWDKHRILSELEYYEGLLLAGVEHQADGNFEAACSHVEHILFQISQLRIELDRQWQLDSARGRPREIGKRCMKKLSKKAKREKKELRLAREEFAQILAANDRLIEARRMTQDAIRRFELWDRNLTIQHGPLYYKTMGYSVN